MAAGFGISQGHQVNQVNLGSLAANVLFEIMDHLSIIDVLRFRQAGIDFFPEKALLMVESKCTCRRLGVSAKSQVGWESIFPPATETASYIPVTATGRKTETARLKRGTSINIHHRDYKCARVFDSLGPATPPLPPSRQVHSSSPGSPGPPSSCQGKLQIT